MFKNWKNWMTIVLWMVSFGVMAEGMAPVRIMGATTADTYTAKLLHDKGVTFVDVRDEEKYREGHIPGAKNLWVRGDQFTAENLAALAPKDKPVVFYCNGVTCQGSSIAATKALEWGWQAVYYYREGFPKWQQSGLPVE